MASFIIFPTMLWYFLALYAAHASYAATSPSLDALDSLVDRFWDFRLRESPEYASKYRIDRYQDRVEEYTEAAFLRRKDAAVGFLAEAEAISASSFHTQARLTLGVLKADLQYYIDGYPYRKHGAYNPFTSFNNPLSEWKRLVGWVAYLNTTDYQNMLARYRLFSKQTDERIELMRIAADEGLAKTTLAVDVAISYIDDFLLTNYTDSFFYGPFADIPSTIRTSERSTLQDEAWRLIKDTIYPSLRKFVNYLKTDYSSKSSAFTGVSSLPDGAQFYESCLRWATSSTLTAAQVYQIGLDEVKRILQRMQQVMTEDGFSNGTIQDYILLLRQNPANFYKTEDEMFQGFKEIASSAHEKLPLLMRKVPTAPLEFAKAPSANYPNGFYSDPSLDGSRAGRFIANVFHPKQKLMLEMYPLALHETEPGHHTHTSYAMTENIPDFRRAIEFRHYYASPSEWPHYLVYSEGWAMYAELLGEEIGAYTKENALFGRLSAEMFRAARLVIDTGLHSMGWSQQRAETYLASHTTLAPESVRNEILRYIANPGQACSYKIGEMRLREIRAWATEELGELFDKRDFHDTVLEIGPAPLQLVEDHVNDWVERRKKEGATSGTRDRMIGVWIWAWVCACAVIRW